MCIITVNVTVDDGGVCGNLWRTVLCQKVMDQLMQSEVVEMEREN